MAWATGTATDYLDLLDRLVTFLTTDTTLVAAGQNWTSLRYSAVPFSATLPGGRISFGSTTNAIVIDSWPLGVPLTSARYRIAGTLTAPSTGSYTFGVKVGSMCEVWIDGTKVYGQYVASTFNTTWSDTFTTTLSSGTHSIEVRYITGPSSSSFLALGWQKPGDGSIAVIPSGSFSSMTLTWGALYSADPSGSVDKFTTAWPLKDAALRGPGLAGGDQIFVNLAPYSDYAGDIYNLVIMGATGFASSTRLFNQPGSTPNQQAALLWNQGMKYWFVANGRRFIVIAKVSTSYESLYGGFLLPYGLPTEIPYPLTIGSSGAKGDVRFSITNGNHGGFWHPCTNSNIGQGSTLAFRNTAGVWEYYTNFSDNGVFNGRVYPTVGAIQYRTSPSDDYALQPCTLFHYDSGGNVWGELDGVYTISGFQNASENILTISGQDYLVVQSGHRTTSVDYAAIKLA